MPVRLNLTNYSTLAIVRLPARELRAAAISTRMIAALKDRERRAHSVTSRTITRLTRREVQNPSTSVRNLLRMNPDFRWIDMFKDIVFPHDISEGSDGAARFNTLVNEVTSGHDQRNALWDYPKMEYNVAYGVRTMEQLHDLIRFFRVARGKLYSFRFLDKVDYTSSFATYEEAREANETTPLDQRIAVGDDETVSWQLIKNYDFDGENAVRPIYKPIPDTVRLAVNGTEIANFECDYSTGMVTIVPRLEFHALGASILYVDLDEHHWKITVIATPDNPNTPEDETSGTPFGIVLPGERFTIDSPQIFGTINAVCISSTPTSLEFTWLEGTEVYQRVGNTEVTVKTNNVPKAGDIVTAGYEFHVPVRFNTDRIPVKLEYYGVGSANEITLVEVRPDEE